MEKNHTLEDEELRLLIEARKHFETGFKCKECSYCHKAWSLIDLAIAAKYSLLAQESRRKEDAETNRKRQEGKADEGKG